MMMDRGIKEPGCSLIEMNGEVHEFAAGDQSHARSDAVYSKLEIGRNLKLAGYVADISEVFLDIREEEKRTTVYQHSEKLALAFGLLNSAPGAAIWIVKNLRMYVDCHSAMNLIYRLYQGEIIVRGRTRFHHFSHGSCSCKDF